MLGRLEGLKNVKKDILAKDLDFVEEILNSNVFLTTDKKRWELSDFDGISYDSDPAEGFCEEDERRYKYGNYKEPYMMGDPRYDRGANPWIEVFGEGDEAEDAYWNTQ